MPCDNWSSSESNLSSKVLGVRLWLLRWAVGWLMWCLVAGAGVLSWAFTD